MQLEANDWLLIANNKEIDVPACQKNNGKTIICEMCQVNVLCTLNA